MKLALNSSVLHSNNDIIGYHKLPLASAKLGRLSGKDGKSFKNNSVIYTMLTIGVSGCGGSSSKSTLDGSVDVPNLETASRAFIENISLDLYNPASRKFIPYCCNVVGTEVVEVQENRFLHFINIMLDVDSSSGLEVPNQSNLIILEIGIAGMSIFDQQVINGNALMHFGDLNGDGVISLIMTLAGEDGRILSDDDQVKKQNLVYDVMLKTVTYFGEPSWSHGGAVIDLTGDGFPEIIDAYFKADGSTIYDGRTLLVKQSGSIFEAGPGMNAFDFGDINNDGILNFYQRVEGRQIGSTENLIVGNVYDINSDLSFNIISSISFGSFSDETVPFVSWNGDVNNPSERTFGNFMGFEFGAYQSWYTKLSDINSDGFLDIVEILSFSKLLDTGDGYFVEGGNEWKLLVVLNEDGDLIIDNARLVDLPFSGAHHGSTLFDFNMDGHPDLYFNISGNESGQGFKINDRIYLNDGVGNFSKLSDDIIFDFDPNFTRNGSYSPVRLDSETYLSGLSSDGFGNNLSYLLIPVSEVL